jgi:hypothetical protein
MIANPSQTSAAKVKTELFARIEVFYNQRRRHCAFVLPLSMPLLLPVGLYRLNWFYPAMMILLGAYSLPFVFLYGMRLFAVLAAVLVGGGTLIAMYFSASFSIGAWYTGTILLAFAGLGRMIANHEYRANTHTA